MSDLQNCQAQYRGMLQNMLVFGIVILMVLAAIIISLSTTGSWTDTWLYICGAFLLLGVFAIGYSTYKGYFNMNNKPQSSENSGAAEGGCPSCSGGCPSCSGGCPSCSGGDAHPVSMNVTSGGCACASGGCGCASGGCACATGGCGCSGGSQSASGGCDAEVSKGDSKLFAFKAEMQKLSDVLEQSSESIPSDKYDAIQNVFQNVQAKAQSLETSSPV
jgi:hypothetical protein